MPSLGSYVKSSLDTLSGDFHNILKWNPSHNRIHCAIRDAAYMMIDAPKFFMYTQSNYGAMRRYLRQARVNKGRVNPEDFKDVDTNVLRESLIRYSQMRGPFRHVDFRFFNWMYLMMMGYVCYQYFSISKMMEEKMDRAGATLSQRRDMFSDDYEEDIRQR